MNLGTSCCILLDKNWLAYALSSIQEASRSSFGRRNYLFKISCCPKCAGCGLGVTVPCWRLDLWQFHWMNCSLPIWTWHPDFTRHHCPPDQDNSVPGLDIDGFPCDVLVRGCLLTAKDNEECSPVMFKEMALLDAATLPRETESYRIPLCRILIVLAGWTITPQALHCVLSKGSREEGTWG